MTQCIFPTVAQTLGQLNCPPLPNGMLIEISLFSTPGSTNEAAITVLCSRSMLLSH